MGRTILLQRSLSVAGLAVGLVAARAEAGALRGRVVDSGRGVSGAIVVATPYASSLDVSRREARGDAAPLPLGKVLADAGGRFSLPVAPGSMDAQVSVEAAGFVAIRLLRPVDDNDDVGDVALTRAVPLAGRVVDGRGQGVADAVVTLEPGASGTRDALPVGREARTGADGSFRFDAASSSGNRVGVLKDGFASVSLSGLHGGGAPLTVALGAASAISGVVERSDGRAPAAGVLVRFVGRGRSRWIETGADGTFRITDAAAGAGRVEAEGGPLGRAETALTVPSAGRLVVVLDPPTRIAGRVVNARTLQPVARARVVATGDGATSVGRAGPDGRYVIDGLATAAYVLSVDDTRFVRYSRGGIRLTRGQAFSADIPLAVGASLSGRVVDEGGKPVAGARVRVGGAGERRFGPRLRTEGAENDWVSTATDGSFKSERLPSGSNLRLTVTHPDFVEGVVGGISLAPGSARAGLEVVLRRGLEIAGTVRDSAGRPVAQADVHLRPGSVGGPRGRASWIRLRRPGTRERGRHGSEWR